MKQYIVDAFTDKLFSGNQAAICVLDDWISDELMMNITKENCFSETAFTVKEGDKYHIRWFTPGGEIDLCGHATLACAFVLFNYYISEEQKVVFSSKSGDIIVERKGELFKMEFPGYSLRKIPVTPEMTAALGSEPIEAYMGRDMLCIMENEAVVREMKPDIKKVKELDGLLLHVTARGSETDCVSRSFAPKHSVDEDPVCGSGHCHIAPYWSNAIGKSELVAYQASARGGTLYCRVEGDRVFLSGKAVLFAISEIML